MGEENMKILVTGVSGFIGYHLSQKLIEKGYKVYGLVRFTSQKQKLPENIIPVTGDLTDYHSIVKNIQYIQPDTVFHLGALTPVSESYHQPVAYAETNYVGTINLLEAIRKHDYEKIRLIAVAGTTEMYHSIHIDDYVKFQPESPYAVSKVASVLYSQYMYRAYHLPTVVAVPCNTYGRAYVNQPHYFIEKLIVNMLKNVGEIKLGNPDIVRDWMYREDHINAYLNILEKAGKDIFGERFYFGTNMLYTTKEVFEIIKKLTGWNGNAVWGVYIRPRESKEMGVYAKKAYERLGWIAEYTLESGLKKAIEEWREVLE